MQRPLTWTEGAAVPGGREGVRAGLLAGHLVAAHLSQLGKQKETHEEARSISPLPSSALKDILHQQLDPRKDVGQKLQGLTLT